MAENDASLYSAAYHGNAASVRRLLARGADYNWRHPHGGATALYVACEFGHKEAARVLLDAGAPVDLARDDGATPLSKACQEGQRVDIVEMLLNKNAQVDRLDSNGMTVLWVATHQGKLKLAEILLKAGADPTIKVQGWSAYDLARKDGAPALRKLLREHLPPGYEEREQRAQQQAAGGGTGTGGGGGGGGGGGEAVTAQSAARELYSAAYHGDEKEVRRLLAVGAEALDTLLGLQSEWSATPLHASARMNHQAVARLLLDARADVDRGHAFGQTPLAAASSRCAPQPPMPHRLVRPSRASDAHHPVCRQRACGHESAAPRSRRRC